MKKTAQVAIHVLLAVLFINVAALAFSKAAWAASGNTQICQPSSNCVIGEFLYDDSYIPITDASCTITSHDPDGGVPFLDSVVMTVSPENDGWYSHTFSNQTTEGVYRTQVCCRIISSAFDTTDVNATSDQIVVGKDISTTTPIRFSSTGTLPAGLVAGTRYYAIKVNSTTIKVATSVANAQAGTAIDLTSQGSGTHTVESDDIMCLDKTFEVRNQSTLTQNDVTSAVWNASRTSYTAAGSFGQALQNIVPSASDIAADTWGYSSRSLSTFGTLVSDIWSNSTRTLTGFGTLVSDIWSNTTRTLTGAGLADGSLATKSDVETKVDAKAQELKDEIKKVSTNSTQTVTNVQNITTEITSLKNTTQETRNLLEGVINKPVIEVSIEEVPDLGAKLNETEGVATQLFTSAQYAKSKAGLIKLKWNSFENSEVLDSVQELTRKLGGENDPSSSGSVFGYISFLKESWDWSLVETIRSQVKAVREVLASIQSEVESSGRSKASYNKVTALVGYLSQLESSIGDISNKSSQKTLFGKLKETRLLADLLDKREEDTKSLLSGWDLYQLADKQKKLSELAKQVVTINRIPSINKTLLSADSVLEKDLKNKSYFVLGIISSNKKLLAKKPGSPLTNTWLELGSIVFKTLVTNPSTLISQKAPIKYYLPPEVKEEDIIETDAGLTVKYDTEKNQYYVSGEFLLAPSETKTISVRTADIWVINKEEIDSFRKQAEELFHPLEKTSFFAQGVTIKSDIDVSLDKVLNLIKSNGTPEAKIRAFREAQIEMKAVLGKTEKLKELVTQAGSIGTLFGFVGGTQTLAVWGLILILVAGFVFMAMYMKILVKQEKDVVTKLSSLKEINSPHHNGENVPVKPMPRLRHTLQFSVILMFFGIGLGLGSGIILGKASLASDSSKTVAEKTQEPDVLGSTSNQTIVKEKVCKSKDEKKVEQSVKIFVPSGGSVNVRSDSSLNSFVITRLEQTSQFVELDRRDGWVQIAVDVEKGEVTYSKGWVSEEFAGKE